MHCSGFTMQHLPLEFPISSLFLQSAAVLSLPITMRASNAHTVVETVYTYSSLASFRTNPKRQLPLKMVLDEWMHKSSAKRDLQVQEVHYIKG